MRSGFLAALATALLAVVPCRAAILVSDVEVTGSGQSLSVHYVLNEPAEIVGLTIYSASDPNTDLANLMLAGDNLKQGPHDFSLGSVRLGPGQYFCRVIATAAPHNGYDVIVPVTDIPDAKTISYGIKVNKVPGSPGYGHIFTADYTAGVVQEMNAAGGFLQNNPVPATGDASGNFSPVGLTFDTNGDYYISDQNVDQIVQFHASGSKLKPTWNNIAQFPGAPADETTGIGPFGCRGFQLFGTGASATVYMAAYNPVPNPVLRSTLGETVKPPEVLFDGGHISGTRIDQVLVTPDQKTAYVSSGAVGLTNLNRFLYGNDPTTGQVDWYLDPDFVQNDPDKATLKQRSRGIAFTQDGKYLWVTQALSGGGTDTNYIAKVSLSALPTDPVTTATILRYAGGLAEAPMDTWFNYDLNSDFQITLADAVMAIKNPAPAGTVVAQIPMPVLDGAAGPVLPFSMDTDPKGNLVVGVNKNPAGSAIVGTSFLVIAPPDDGSSDSATSPTFNL